MPRPTRSCLCIFATLVTLALPLSASAQKHNVSQRDSPRLHLTGGIGLSTAFAENVALPALAIDARVYSAEGFGGLLRVGYEGLIFLNFGVIDAAFAFRREIPGNDFAGFGLSAAIGLSAMIRDSVYHFTGDDVALAPFGSVGIDVRLDRLIIGIDAVGRWQIGVISLSGPETRGQDWTELGAMMRIGGEVLL